MNRLLMLENNYEKPLRLNTLTRSFIMKNDFFYRSIAERMNDLQLLTRRARSHVRVCVWYVIQFSSGRTHYIQNKTVD